MKITDDERKVLNKMRMHVPALARLQKLVLNSTVTREDLVNQVAASALIQASFDEAKARENIYRMLNAIDAAHAGEKFE